jgi:hypothetical protein
MSKHKHEPDNPQQHDRARQAPTGGDQGDLPNRTANTSLTNPGPPPQNAVSGQFGEVGETGQGSDLTAQMESTGPSSGNVPGGDDLIPWDPTGKIDDEVERRYRKPPATSQTPAGNAGRGATPPAPSPQPGSGPGANAPQSGTIPRDPGTDGEIYGGDPGSGTSGDYSGPITSAPADPGQSNVRTMQDVRSAPVPAHGARDAQPPADGGATGEAPRETPNKAPYAGRRPDPGGYGEVQ